MQIGVPPSCDTLLCVQRQSVLACVLEQKNVTWNSSHENTSPLPLTFYFILVAPAADTLTIHPFVKAWCDTQSVSQRVLSLLRCPTSLPPIPLCIRDLSEEKALASLVYSEWVSGLPLWLWKPTNGTWVSDLSEVFYSDDHHLRVIMNMCFFRFISSRCSHMKILKASTDLVKI